MNSVTIFELFVTGGIPIATIIGAWIHMRISVASLKTELSYIQKELETEKEGNKQNYKELSEKIDKIFSLMSEIKVSIAERK